MSSKKVFPWLSSVFFASAMLISCSEDVPVEYSEVNRKGFMAACTRTAGDIEIADENSEEKKQNEESGVDDPLITDICRCTLEKIEPDLSFEEFKKLDNDLVEGLEDSLSEEVLNSMYDCVIEETDV